MRSLLLFGIMMLLFVPGAWSQPTCPEGGSRQDVLSTQATKYLWSLDPRKVTPSRRLALQKVYTPCGFRLLWSQDGVVSTQARDIMSEMRLSPRKGLRPSDYGVNWWGCRAVATEIPCSDRYQELAQFDVDLTAAVTRFAGDLRYGRVPPVIPKAGYASVVDDNFLAEFVRRLAITDNVRALVSSLEPAYPGYLRTEAALSRMLTQRLDQTETYLPTTVLNLKQGQTSEIAGLLNQRLSELSYLPSPLMIPIRDEFDGQTTIALTRFQKDHGLDPTGAVNTETERQLNISIEKRIEQFALTLERWRWLPQQFNTGPIVVNIPEFRLRAYDNAGNVQLSMAVVVGNAANRLSPVLQAELHRIILHPYWNVPADITQLEMVPAIRRDPRFLVRHGFELVGRDQRIAHPSRTQIIHLLSSGTLRIRQMPGPKNALGDIKFEFPNSFDVYMHGTSQASLFAHTRRDLSHGCIRLEAPDRLAVWVLQQQKTSWDRERLKTELSVSATEVVTLDKEIPVVFVYGTGFAAEDGSLRFLNDVYGIDAQLETGLARISAQREHDDRIPWSPLAIAPSP